MLNRAEDIQKGCTSSESYIDNIETLQLISKCYLKLKNYKEALKYIDSTLELIAEIHGENSKEFAVANVLKSKIYSEEGNLVQGIEELKQSISTRGLMQTSSPR